MGCASNQSISKWVVLASSACSPLGGEASPPPVRARAGLVTGGIATHFERVDAAPCKQVGANSRPHAWLIAGENAEVTPMDAFPAVATAEVKVSPHTLWAIEERPGYSGQFLMRLPLDGKPSFYLIRGTERCHHLEGPPAELTQVSDDTAQIRVTSEGWPCVSKQAAGNYSFKGGAFTRFTPSDAPDTRTNQTVTAKQAVFTFDGDSIVVTRNGVVERNAFPNNDPGRPVERARAFELTAGGQEV